MSARPTTAPKVPERPQAAEVAAATAASPINNDPYGQLSDLDFVNLGAGTGGYVTDAPRPKGADEDLLF